MVLINTDSASEWLVLFNLHVEVGNDKYMEKTGALFVSVTGNIFIHGYYASAWVSPLAQCQGVVVERLPCTPWEQPQGETGNVAAVGER